jgi:hypothetical protein
VHKKYIFLVVTGLILMIAAVFFGAEDDIVPGAGVPAAASNDALSVDATWPPATSRAGPDRGFDESTEIDVLWTRAKASLGLPNSSDDTADQLQKLAQAKPQVLRKLIALYDSESDAKAKELLRSMLSATDLPEVFNLARRLASSKDAGQRSEGLAMLKNLSSKPEEKLVLIRDVLANEQAPGLLLQALAALQPPAPIEANVTGVKAIAGNLAPNQAEILATVAQLQTLSKNADAAVRSQSLLQLAQWDKSDMSQTVLLSALTDHASEVRQSAVFAIAQSGVQSNNAKAALLTMVNDTNENTQVRGSALQVLEGFTLNKTELANTAQLRAQLQAGR